MSDLQNKDIKKCYYETGIWPSDISAIFKYMTEEPTKARNLKKHSACVVWLCACAHTIKITVRCTVHVSTALASVTQQLLSAAKIHSTNDWI
jgi:hypothetical protein